MKIVLANIVRLAVIVVGSAAIISVLSPQPAYAVDFFGGVCEDTDNTSTVCGNSGKDNISGTDGVVLKAAGLIAIIASISAVIVIIVAGLMFITAGGDTSKAGNARKTIVYAVVGLVVIFLARTIIGFVVTRVG